MRWEIQSLGQRLGAAATADERARAGKLKVAEKADHDIELKRIVQMIKKVLGRIEDAVPLINLAITASGANLSSSLPSTVSPSRLLQASTFLTAGDSQYSLAPNQAVQIGPTFMLSLYMLFLGHLRPQNEEDIRESTWKEVIHKANVKLIRVPINDLYKLPREPQTMRMDDGTPKSPNPLQQNSYFPSEEGSAKSNEYAYQLVIVEDLDDDRVHDFEDNQIQPGPFQDTQIAGIREAVPIHQVSKIFYADTGKILNIGSDGETNSPVLLLKRDTNAAPPRRMMDHYDDGFAASYRSTNGTPGNDSSKSGDLYDSSLQLSRLENSERSSTPPTPSQKQLTDIDPTNAWHIPPDLDPEWLAFEVYTETSDSDDESEPSAPSKSSRPPSAQPSRAASLEPSAMVTLSHFSLNTPISSKPDINGAKNTPQHPPIRTSLSLLEVLLRLLALQQFQQTPHLSIPDELLTFFLSESASTTGAAQSDVEERKRLRDEARRHVGFDPYDESPIKRRGEEYQYQRQHASEVNSESEWAEEARQSPLAGRRRYETPDFARFDEGYDTHGFIYPSPANSNQARNSPLLLKGQRSRDGTPRSSPSGRASLGTPPVRWKSDGLERMKRGSPLARPERELTDEALGSSPASSGNKDESKGGAE